MRSENAQFTNLLFKVAVAQADKSDDTSAAGSISTEGLPPIDMDTLFTVNRNEWLSECDAVQKYFNEQIPHDTPSQLQDELDSLREKLNYDHVKSSAKGSLG